MLSLYRPQNHRAIAGVALGLAEFYEVPVVVIRLLFVTAFLATPLALLTYLLLAISIQGEEAIASELSMAYIGSASSRYVRFEAFTELLRQRLRARDGIQAVIHKAIAILLVFFGLALELPKLGIAAYASPHLLSSSLLEPISRFGTGLFYLTAGVAVILIRQRVSTRVIYKVPIVSHFTPAPAPARLIGGIAAGLSRMLEVDVAFLRVCFILLNIFTCGIFGIAYLLALLFMNRSARLREEPKIIRREADAYDRPMTSRTARSRAILVIGWLLLLLSGMSLASELGVVYLTESFIGGLALASIGFLISLVGVRAQTKYSAVLILSGVDCFLFGIGDLCRRVFHVQLSSVERTEVLCVMGFVSLVYYSVVVLGGIPKVVGILFGAACLGSAFLMIGGVVPAQYLAALNQFYEFFYPMIFFGFGVWILMD